jgi:mRNA interferase RelE/StbE
LAWTVEWDKAALRDAEKLDNAIRQRIVRYLEERIATDEDPRRVGAAVFSNRMDLWRYRVGNYRIVCSIEDKLVVVLVLGVDHRSRIYKRGWLRRL